MPTGSPPYILDNTPIIWDWLAQTADPDRRHALLIWSRAICHAPSDFATRSYRSLRTGRDFHYSDIPGARTRVTFVVNETPVRAVRIVRISDDDYGVE